MLVAIPPGVVPPAAAEGSADQAAKAPAASAKVRILPDLAGFTTASDSVEAIASKIAPAVLVDDNPDSLPA